MSTYEHDILQQYKDESGNIHVLYPVTKSENVDGIEKYATQDSVDNLKKSVSDGKSTVASAITSMGVSTASDATFSTMSSNIKSIFTSPTNFSAKYKNTFRNLAACPMQLAQTTAIQYNGFIYVHGSTASGADPKAMYAYSIYDNTWTQLTSSPVEHHWSNTAVLIAGSIYYFGSWSGTQIPLYRYNIAWNNWENLGVSMPIAVEGAVAFNQGGAIRLLSSAYTNYRQYYYYYSMESNTFTQGTNIPNYDVDDIYGCLSSAVVKGSYVYLICARSSKIKKFSLQSWGTENEVTTAGPIYSEAVKIGHYIYIMSLGSTNTMYCFNTNNDTLTKIVQSYHFGYRSSCDCYGDEIFYFGSKTPGDESKATNVHTCNMIEKY